MALLTTETYITIAGAQAYAAKMGLELPVDVTELETLLRRAAIYLDRIYGPRYIGETISTTQLLAFPRYNVTGIPTQIGEAQTELAALLYANGGVLPEVAPRVKKTVIKLEGIETSLEYADVYGYGLNPYETIDKMLFAYLVDTSGDGTIRRKLTMTRGY